MVDGRLLRGFTGKAGHLGHTCLDVEAPPDICGTPGSLEDAIGNCTIGARSGGRYGTTHELVEAYRRGEPGATAVWLKSVRSLACAIGTFTNILDPEVAVIGGGIARAGAALFEPLERMVREVEWKTGVGVRLVPAQLGELAGAYGAAFHARRCGPEAGMGSAGSARWPACYPAGLRLIAAGMRTWTRPARYVLRGRSRLRGG